MLSDLQALVADFASCATSVVPGWPCRATTDFLAAPHRPPVLPAGSCAVYIFALSQQAGQRAPAGPGAVLKVGRVGAKSGPRFSYQHYTSAAPSTLAKSLLKYRVLWPWLGITDLTTASVKDWMLSNLDRAHVYVPDGHAEVLASLEIYLRARVGSVFEGAA